MMSFIQQFYQDCLVKFALMGLSPGWSPHAFRLWIGIVADTIRCSLSLWTMPQSIFPVQRHSSMPVLPSEKKILCPCTSVLDSVFLDFWINEKAATPHHEWQEYFLLLGFAMLCNGFGIQNHAAIRQPKRAAYVRRQSALSIGWHFILPFMCYLIFNLPIPSRVF